MQTAVVYENGKASKCCYFGAIRTKRSYGTQFEKGVRETGNKPNDLIEESEVILWQS